MVTLMQQKLDLLAKVLLITQAEHFTGENAQLEDETTRYAVLYEKRSHLMDQVKEINRRLAVEQSAQLDDEGERIARETRKTIQEILKWDGAHASVAQKLAAHIKTGMKELRLGTAASTRYQTEYAMSESLHFDQKN